MGNGVLRHRLMRSGTGAIGRVVVIPVAFNATILARAAITIISAASRVRIGAASSALLGGAIVDT